MFADPVKNLKALGLREDMIVADLGAGTGFYSIAAAQMVPKGKVYAIEVQADYIEIIRNKIKEEYLKNIEVLWGNVEKIGGTKLGDSIVDVVVASNVFFQAEDKDKLIEEIKRILKPGGSVLLVDWSDEPSATGSVRRGTLSQNEMREMFGKKEFVFVRDIDTGAHHYGMILKKPILNSNK